MRQQDLLESESVALECRSLMPVLAAVQKWKAIASSHLNNALWPRAWPFECYRPFPMLTSIFPPVSTPKQQMGIRLFFL